MADHEAAHRTRLLAHAGTSALVGTRVWLDHLPQEQKNVTYMPAVVVQQITGESEHVMGGIAGIAELRTQVDSYDTTRAGCEALRQQVRDALQAYSGTHDGTTITNTGVEQGTPKWDPDAKLYRSTQDFLGWGTE